MSDFDVTRISEKRFYTIPDTLFTADGTADGLVTLPSTFQYKVGMVVSLFSNSQDTRRYKIKRVISETQMHIGEEKTPIDKYADLSMFLVSDTATVSFTEQKRPVIDILEIQRQTYEEEPTVALRNHLVDWLGRSYDKTNPIPVELADGSISIGTVNAQLEVQLSAKDDDPDTGDVHDSIRIGDGTDELEINSDGSINVNVSPTNTPTIANLAVVLANTEYSYALPTETKQFSIKDRDGNSKLKIAYVANDSGTLYQTIDMGVRHEVNGLNTLPGFTVYFQSNKANRTIEIVSWV